MTQLLLWLLVLQLPLLLLPLLLLLLLLWLRLLLSLLPCRRHLLVLMLLKVLLPLLLGRSCCKSGAALTHVGPHVLCSWVQALLAPVSLGDDAACRHQGHVVIGHVCLWGRCGRVLSGGETSPISVVPNSEFTKTKLIESTQFWL
jgi:hypothetical protein